MNRDNEEQVTPAARNRREEVDERSSPSFDETLRALEREEPLSLAEEIAAEKRRRRGRRPG